MCDFANIVLIKSLTATHKIFSNTKFTLNVRSLIFLISFLLLVYWATICFCHQTTESEHIEMNVQKPSSVKLNS